MRILFLSKNSSPLWEIMAATTNTQRKPQRVTHPRTTHHTSNTLTPRCAAPFSYVTEYKIRHFCTERGSGPTASYRIGTGLHIPYPVTITLSGQIDTHSTNKLYASLWYIVQSSVVNSYVRI